MQRLLLITPDFPPARGGIQLLSYRLAVGLEGFERCVVAPSSDGAREFDLNSGVRTLRVSANRRVGAARHGLLNAAALRHALRFRPHVTLSTHIVTSPGAAAVRRMLSAPTVQYFHAKEVGDKRRLAAFAARQAHTAIAVSAYTAHLIESTGASPARVRLISPGVDFPPDPQPLSAARPTVLTVSRLEDRYKGHDVLIRALARVRAAVPGVEWVVIGDGPLRSELEQRARSYGVTDCARFLGAVCDEERDLWLRRADVFAMPSRLPEDGRAGEGFGIVYLEAAAYGKPVVAGNVGGALDAAIDGETGLLVDPNDPSAVARAITKLLLDRECAQRLGRAGRERAQNFAWPIIVQRVEAVLRETLDAVPRLDALAAGADKDAATRTVG